MDSKPLVAHIIYMLATGGLENGLVNILNRFPEKRYRHVIICITTADDFSSRITAPDVEVIQMHRREGHDLAFYGRLWQLLRRLRPAIVHSRNLAALEAQICTLGLWGVKRVHGEHGREINDVDGSNKKYLLLRRCMRILVHHYIAVSKDLQGWLVERVGIEASRVTQIYNGVDHERFAPGSVKPLALLPQPWQARNDIVVAGTVGRLAPVKDQRTLLQAAARLRDMQPELCRRLCILLVGDGPLRAELQALAVSLDIEELVWFAGDRRDVPELFHLMDVFVLPSLGEGISNTVLEAMASGLPVIATAVGGNLELVKEGENGALIPVGDVSSLASNLASLLADEQLRLRQGRAARQFVESNFHWDKTVGEYLAVYDNVLRVRSNTSASVAD